MMSDKNTDFKSRMKDIRFENFEVLELEQRNWICTEAHHCSIGLNHLLDTAQLGAYFMQEAATRKS